MKDKWREICEFSQLCTEKGRAMPWQNPNESEHDRRKFLLWQAMSCLAALYGTGISDEDITKLAHEIHDENDI